MSAAPGLVFPIVCRPRRPSKFTSNQKFPPRRNNEPCPRTRTDCLRGFFFGLGITARLPCVSIRFSRLHPHSVLPQLIPQWYFRFGQDIERARLRGDYKRTSNPFAYLSRSSIGSSPI